MIMTDWAISCFSSSQRWRQINQEPLQYLVKQEGKQATSTTSTSTDTCGRNTTAFYSLWSWSRGRNATAWLWSPHWPWCLHFAAVPVWVWRCPGDGPPRPSDTAAPCHAPVTPPHSGHGRCGPAGSVWLGGSETGCQSRFRFFIHQVLQQGKW